jgi:UDP-glucose:tetrahydrobiopterin glucosyltransferase
VPVGLGTLTDVLSRHLPNKVALLSPFLYPVVDPCVGGTGVFCQRLAAGLIEHGVEVCCYACEGSSIPGVEVRTFGVRPDEITFRRPVEELDPAEVAAIRERERAIFQRCLDDAAADPEIELVHNSSFSAVPIEASGRLAKPLVHTIHVPPDPAVTEVLGRGGAGSLLVVAVSESQARLWRPFHPDIRVIPNSLDTRRLPPCRAHDGRLAFVGRIHPSKGVVDAIEVAVRLGKPLHLYGAVPPTGQSYYLEEVEPLVRRHPQVVMHGLVDQRTLFSELALAQALLVPSRWEEPFGYVNAEAMALGVPVVTYDRGAARELIPEGIGGHVVAADDIDAITEAAARTQAFDRAACCAYARERFDAERSTRAYLELYGEALGR